MRSAAVSRFFEGDFRGARRLKSTPALKARRSEAADALKSSAEGVWEVKVGCGYDPNGSVEPSGGPRGGGSGAEPEASFRWTRILPMVSLS
jgi:hypothetical protein